ncbi:exodeoxyribonuclease VII large subunit [Candidatus Saccharibacteria bacterium]|nr:exodeoxyribonuclease VII large subunit [Candidatus Saccharibacteria bacterium]
MKVIITATPKLTQWGKFSLTVKAIRPSGEGSLKKSFDLLKEKLDKEGLFAPERKRQIPSIPQRIAVISSTQAAGYADFIKIVNDRWGGVVIDVAHVQVQGEAAPDQIIRALKYFNSRETVADIIVIIRGGGSADDLSAFNDELLVREIAASRIPTVVGVGHEIDESLADLAADVRAATPSNAAQLVVPDRHEIIRATRSRVQSLLPRMDRIIIQQREQTHETIERMLESIDSRVQKYSDELVQTRRVIAELDPKRVLDRGYAILRGSKKIGETIAIETDHDIIKAEVLHVSKK